MKLIPFEDVPENLHELYDIVGGALFTEIVDTYGGEMIYIPSRSKLEKKHIQETICNEYDGFNVKVLAKKYGYTERHIRNILAKSKVN